MTVNRNDLLCGAIFIVIGLAFAADALVELPLGSAFRMGPGYFPLVLAGLLVLLGAGIIVSGVGVATPDRVVRHHPDAANLTGLQAALARLGPWRGVIVILASPIIFGLGIQTIGLIPSLALAVLVASFASSKVSILFALIMTAILTAFCYLVFAVGLRLPVRLFGPWLDPLLSILGIQ
jgi:putative tricarboxylic transport membrane protein